MIGKLKDYEIDFIAEKRNEYQYFQVALRIDNDETAKREFGNLLKIKDNYPKYVITLDEYQGRSYKGIVHLPLRNFLYNFH
jgi:predicted AAA+ superfamily ATPase